MIVIPPPPTFQHYVEDWGQQIYQALSKTCVLPDGKAKEILPAHPDDGFIFLWPVCTHLNPTMPLSKIDGSTFKDYVSPVQCFNSTKLCFACFLGLMAINFCR
jgi:hypothetical protein